VTKFESFYARIKMDRRGGRKEIPEEEKFKYIKQELSKAQLDLNQPNTKRTIMIFQHIYAFCFIILLLPLYSISRELYKIIKILLSAI
jgi:hypothetical protein